MRENSEKRRVCVIAACYNEEAVIELFYERLSGVLQTLPDYRFEILLVDDGSSDRTLAILNELHAKDPQLSLISLSRNFGHQVALTAGLDAVDADAAIIMDCDLQHPPELIPELIRRWEAGAEIVSTIRVATEKTSLLKSIISVCFYWIINLLSDTRITPNSADFCLLSSKALNAMQQMPERHRFMRGMIAWMGFQRDFVEFKAPARAAGESKYSWRKMIGLGWTAIYSFSAKPLRIAVRFGVLLAALGMFYLIFVLWAAIFRPEKVIPGWASVIGVLLIMSGVQLVFTGLIGEYVARLYEEAKQRPLYFLKQSKRARTFDGSPTQAGSDSRKL